MNNSQVSHAWANSKPGKGSNYSSDGTTLFSYSTAIGKHTTDSKKRSTILLTTKSYSNSTARHQSYAERAVSGSVHHVDNVNATSKAEHQANFADRRDNIEALIRKASKARTAKAYLIERAQQRAAEANLYAEAFGLRARVKLSDNIDQMLADALEARKKEDKKNSAKRKKEEQTRAKQYASDLADWLAGRCSRTQYDRATVYLRLVNNGETVQTSKGAEFPATHAKRAFRLISKVKQLGTAWHKNGESCPVGVFQVDSISEGGDVVAGCHVIKWEQIEDMARQLGLLETKDAA